MSSEALAREISVLVSRSLGGEEIDTVRHGADLAAKYPDLGMSAELIGKAIGRAAGMMKAVRDGRAEAAAAPAPAEVNGSADRAPPAPAKARNGGAHVESAVIIAEKPQEPETIGQSRGAAPARVNGHSPPAPAASGAMAFLRRALSRQ